MRQTWRDGTMLLCASSSPFGEGERGGQSANDGMPVRHCTGGPSDEELAREVLTHAREEHDASDLTEERAREMVASHAQGTEDAS